MTAREPSPDGLLAAAESRRKKTKHRLIGIAFTIAATVSLALLVTGVVSVGTGRHGTVSGNLLGAVALIGFLQGPYMTITGNKPLNRDPQYWKRKREQQLRAQQARVVLQPPPPPIYYDTPETPQTPWQPEPEPQQQPYPQQPQSPHPPQQG